MPRPKRVEKSLDPGRQECLRYLNRLMANSTGAVKGGPRWES